MLSDGCPAKETERRCHAGSCSHRHNRDRPTDDNVTNRSALVVRASQLDRLRPCPCLRRARLKHANLFRSVASVHAAPLRVPCVHCAMPHQHFDDTVESVQSAQRGKQLARTPTAGQKQLFGVTDWTAANTQNHEGALTSTNGASTMQGS